MTLPPPPARVLIAGRDREALAGWLRQRRPGLEIRTAELDEVTAGDLAWADAYLGFRPPPHLPLDGLRWVHSTGAGVDAFLFRRAFPDGTLLTRTDEPFGTQIGEWCVARALAFTQQLFAFREDQQSRRWNPRPLRLLRDEPVLVAGTGEVGTGVAAAFAGLGCTVRGVSRRGGSRAPFRSVASVDRLPEAVREAGVIVLTMPLTESTFHLFDATVLGHCRGALLLNVGRGSLVDEAAILPALDAGHLSGAALDVFEEEPLPATSPLWDDPRVIIAPHLAGFTTVAGAGAGFLRVIEALERGELPGLAVDPARGY
jgi:phosphoglycerate dehydrogenase-like enzyme